MRRPASLAVLAAAVAVPAARAATTHEVAIRDTAYDPSRVVAATGDTVRWTNRDLQPHTVTFPGQDGHEVLPGRDITITFRTRGTYSYTCDFHPVMKGTVVVQGTATSSSTTTSTAPPASTTTTAQDARGSAITAPPDTTTTTSTTSTTVPTDDTTTTTGAPDDGTAASPSPGDDDTERNVDGPGTVAAVLLFAVSGAGSFLIRKGALP